MEGLTSLRTRGVRGLTVLECVLRRSRETAQASLPGWPPENKPQVTDKPPAERTLQAWSDVSRTIITHGTGEAMLRRLTPLAGVQEDRRQRLG